jgi:Periplasmic serine proteases (ClpP class)
MEENLAQKTIKKVSETSNLTEILNELRDAQSGIRARQNIIREIEKLENTHLVLYVESIGNPKSGINHGDAVPLGSILDNIGNVDNIDLLIQSGGGDGNAAEKIIEMCRAHSKKRFRVIVPNMAKSAATLITFGADEIIMGYLSELGPIDAQIPIKVSGQIQFISAQSFIDSRNELVISVHKAKKTMKTHFPTFNSYLPLMLLLLIIVKN